MAYAPIHSRERPLEVKMLRKKRLVAAISVKRQRKYALETAAPNSRRRKTFQVRCIGHCMLAQAVSLPVPNSPELAGLFGKMYASRHPPRPNSPQCNITGRLVHSPWLQAHMTQHCSILLSRGPTQPKSFRKQVITEWRWPKYTTRIAGPLRTASLTFQRAHSWAQAQIP